MNGQEPTTMAGKQPEMEVKKFTAAEFKALQQKMQKYQEAANVVNEFLTFLQEQYGVSEKEGWKLGEGCFVRPVKAAEGESKLSAFKELAAAQPKRKSPARAAKKAATADLPPLAQGENAATVAQNGQLATEPTL